MTQDPYGQPPGSGYVVRGEVVPDDEANAPPPTAPMTRFQKVASAFRGDRTAPAMPDLASSDQGAEPTGPQSPDPDGTWPGTTPASPDVQDVRDQADPDASRPEDVGAVRSADERARDYWDDTGETDSEEATAAAAQDEPAADTAAHDATMPQPGLYGATARTDADDAPAGSATAGTATAAGAPNASGVAAAEPGPLGRPAGVPVQEDGSDSAPGDVTYGGLLPDTAEFRARWHQVQFRFVDDPRGSVTEADDVIAQVTAKLEAALAERQRALRDRWSEGKSTDTESLRETLLMYRAFLDQLTGPGAG